MSATVRTGLKELANRDTTAIIGKKNVSLLQASKQRKHLIDDNSTKLESSDKETQSVAQPASSCQTIVSTFECVGEVTADDLCWEEPSAAYWKTLAETTEKKIEDEFDRSLNLSCRLNESLNDTLEVENRLNDLVEVINEEGFDSDSSEEQQESDRETDE